MYFLLSSFDAVSQSFGLAIWLMYELSKNDRVLRFAAPDMLCTEEYSWELYLFTSFGNRSERQSILDRVKTKEAPTGASFILCC
ncbi:hypothetical protein [Pontibacter ruber]|uniref:hypothetical protein n=1 Tax=Pontibacter ruber TaxID=1343895 RepID=UPI002027FE98|nr:hypothetical protein [Pontibacter ruber]